MLNRPGRHTWIRAVRLQLGPTHLLTLAVICILIATSVATITARLKTPNYRSEAVVNIRILAGPDTGAFSSADRADREAANQVLVAKSPTVINDAAKELGISAIEAQRALTVTAATGADAMRFGALANNPDVAAKRAETYASVYVQSSLDRSLRAAQQQQVELQRQVDALLSQPAQAAEQQAATTAQLTRLGNELAQLKASTVFFGSSDATSFIVSHAEPPRTPSGLTPLIAGLLAGSVALVISFLAIGTIAVTKARLQRRTDG